MHARGITWNVLPHCAISELNSNCASVWVPMETEYTPRTVHVTPSPIVKQGGVSVHQTSCHTHFLSITNASLWFISLSGGFVTSSISTSMSCDWSCDWQLIPSSVLGLGHTNWWRWCKPNSLLSWGTLSGCNREKKREREREWQRKQRRN